MGESGFELVSNRIRSNAEQTIDRLRKALRVLQGKNPVLASEFRHLFLQRGLDLENILEAPNPDAFVSDDAVNHLDVNGLEEIKDKAQECCDKSPKDLAKKALTSLSKKLESVAGAGGDDATKKALGILNKALFAVDASQRIKKACSPLWGCDDFERTGELSSCLLCCNSINSLFGKEVAGLAFLTSCRIACVNAD